ncbi:hypothetical protein M0805_006997 [Coniferiporia weirii]|nr:hypothetical protein M0805_006997 [Coniferiporia weirii]
MSASTSRANVRPAKRARPPRLTLGLDGLRHVAPRAIAIEAVSYPDVDGVDDSEDRPSPPLSPTSSSPIGDPGSPSLDSDSELSDDLSKNLEMLEKLRRNVHKNLRLRPLRMSTAPPDIAVSAAHSAESDNADILFGTHQHRSSSPTSASDSSAAPSPALSIYYTPTTELRESPISARYIGNGYTRVTTGAPVSLGRPRALASPVASVPTSTVTTPAVPHSPLTREITADSLFDRLAASSRPLLIDTRPPASYISSRILHSLNIAIPSLIMRRCTKPGGGFPSLDTLRTYITTDGGKCKWDDMMKRSGAWDGDFVIYDEEMDEKNRDNIQVLSWTLIALLQPLANNGSVLFLKGGVAAARARPASAHYIIAGEQDLPTDSRTDPLSDDSFSRKGGLFQLDTHTAARSKAMPEVELPSTSPGPLISSSNHNMLCDLSPSPSPSTSAFPLFTRPRKSSVPNLRKLDTTSAERLVPKLTVRTVPIKSNSLAAPSMSRHSSSSSLRSNSPSHLNLSYSNKNGPSTSLSPPSTNSSTECLSPSGAFSTFTSPRSPNTPMGFPASPATARPELDQPPTTEEPLPTFTVSSILPNFLYLGPEPASPEHVEELQSLGVRRILNIAIECDDDQGLRLKEKFERYTRIPMRDIVEEENVARSVREACEALDDARLHSAPTYVHCKAGKSRSVTAVIAYLIHANHWTLSRAYAFVTERRKGISPNIGFVSELMTFEEQELGGKSVGVVNSSTSLNGGDGDDYGGKPSNFGYTTGSRRAANLRESLPPILASQNSEMIMPGQHSAGGLSSNVARVGDSGQEVEIKDASGRYRHARRAPVDENTLQPMRRVSKAGLESSLYLTADL